MTEILRPLLQCLGKIKLRRRRLHGRQKKFFWGIWLLGIFQCAMASEEYSSDSYDSGGDHYWSPRPYKKSPVKKVTIIENAVKFDETKDDPEDCATFKVTEKDIKEYFSKAKVVSRGAYMHEINWSECSASGEIEFANGKSGKWSVQKYRAGFLWMDGKGYHFDCQPCRSKVFE